VTGVAAATMLYRHLPRCRHVAATAIALIIPMIIQTILLDPSEAVWTDGPSNVSSLDPSGAVQIDAEHPSRNRALRHEAWCRVLLTLASVTR
jgi:hypothetical protein